MSSRIGLHEDEHDRAKSHADDRGKSQIRTGKQNQQERSEPRMLIDKSLRMPCASNPQANMARRCGFKNLPAGSSLRRTSRNASNFG